MTSRLIRHCRSFLILSLLAGSVAFGAAQPAPPEKPTRWVTDNVGFLSAGVRGTLDQQLEAYERQSGHQVLVWIGETTGDTSIEEFAVRAFEAWGVGRQGVDDGAVLFIMSRDRRLRIEVGYGLEGTFPDILASRVINEVITPKLRDGDPDGAVTSGVAAMLQIIGGNAEGALPERRPSGSLSIGQILFFALIGIVFLFILITNPSLAIYLLASILSNRSHRGGGNWGGGGGWGGGGFSGGGGRSGGGGASGSW